MSQNSEPTENKLSDARVLNLSKRNLAATLVALGLDRPQIVTAFNENQDFVFVPLADFEAGKVVPGFVIEGLGVIVRHIAVGSVIQLGVRDSHLIATKVLQRVIN
jgi:hypothetical protein